MSPSASENEPTGAPKPGSREAPYSVARVVQGVNRTLERVVGNIWVEGEVTSLSRPSSGHLYFSLRDAKAELRAVMWKSDAGKLKFEIEDGMTLRARVRLGLYEQGGKFQLYVQAAEPAGLGADALALEKLKAKLAAEGLFARGRKRPLPMLPRRIGVVTSRTGAAVRDIVRSIQRRFPVPIVVAHAQVQGPTAPREIVHALGEVVRAGVDVIIVGRGGGSSADLGAFNDERVVRAVASAPVPVISAVGHEVDFTLTCLAADHRAATPTMAGEMSVPVLTDLSAGLAAIERRLARELRFRVDAARQTVESLSERGAALVAASITRRRQHLDGFHRALLAAHPSQRISAARGQLTALTPRLDAAWEKSTSVRRQALATAAGKLDAMSPLRVLERGYAIAQSRGTVVTDAQAVAPGDPLAVRLSRGEIHCRVESVRHVEEE